MTTIISMTLTQETPPPPGLRGGLQAQVCSGSGISIPTGIIDLPQTYSINFDSTPEEDADPMQTPLHVSLDGEHFADYVVGDGPGFLASYNNYTFAGGPLTLSACLT